MPEPVSTTSERAAALAIAPRGIPAEINTSINHLANLLSHLPEHLPMNPSQSTYHFGLDPDDISEEGHCYALNRCLEVAFEVSLLPAGAPLVLKERGPRWKGLVSLFRQAAKKLINPSDREFYVSRWIERITAAAKLAGAKIPIKRKDRRAVSPPGEGATSRQDKRTRIGLPKEIILLSSDDEGESGQLTKSSPWALPTVEAKPRSQTAITLSTHPTNGPSSDTPTPTQTSPSALAASGSTVPNTTRLIPPSLVPSLLPTESTTTLPEKGMRQRSILDFASKTTLSEFRKQQDKITEKYGTDPKVEKEQKQRREEMRAEKKREQGRLRQQHFRERQRKAESKLGGGVGKKAKDLVLGQGIGSSSATINLAEISRPEGQTWKVKRTGKKGGVLQKRHQRVNWYHPLLWTHINRVAPKASWSPKYIVLTLQGQYPDLFGKLHRGTVVKWLSKNDRRRWSTATQKNVERRHTLAGSGRAGILTKHPELVDEIKRNLQQLRDSGVWINRLLTRSIILSILREKKPQLLENFKCSEQFVGQFLEGVMDWSVRRGTQAAAHIPDDANIVCERALFRIVHLITFYDIPPGLIINMDQTGIILFMANNKMYGPKGASQITIAGKDEKRAYTLCVATTPAGDILPFQQVWSGKTKQSLPSDQAPGMDEAKELGFDFASADSKKTTSHFSTLKTMKELAADQKAVLFIDCYPVHIGKDFRIYIFEEFPNVFLIFVPANCTGIFQPADVGLNRILKHNIRQEALNFLVDNHSQQTQGGLSAAQVKLTTSLPVLRNASVQPIVNLYNFFSGFSGRQIIQRAWEKCTVNEWNLGESCLYSLKTKAAYREYLKRDEILRKEIELKLGADPVRLVESDDIGRTETDRDNEDAEDEPEDATDIPLAAVIQAEMGFDDDTVAALQIPDAVNRFCASYDAVLDDDGVLMPTGDSENVWAYRDDGSAWGEALPA
ncbi:hypothetical protein M413DRAFT_13027 [Hebeloma cylindrosporum]|uniref:DDE-1 domain-containing protein n=1 Tax=Hebeloma cylindrosporum TaxID=76867 RepID=A0A0C2YAL7_HEBCY|nr:hypothetical protein M413DRAFT_13027 [Hebeloma cylindrosporum h7]